ncbi:hypothetical protein CHARACLAT_018887 [Characodon lateralis]|uniref:Uncharacterized protein n=1 Tax=Characodon lateralis TaxID=208331 RepID=A0ABU7ENW1_9TELE|nr:hypothetical protein [Characodon lateralis]
METVVWRGVGGLHLRNITSEKCPTLQDLVSLAREPRCAFRLESYTSADEPAASMAAECCEVSVKRCVQKNQTKNGTSHAVTHINSSDHLWRKKWTSSLLFF